MIKFPKCNHMHITYNDHKSCYRTVEQAIEEDGELFDFRDEIEKQMCIDTDTLWICQWYPRTPIGFLCLAAPSFEGLMDYVNEVNDREDE